MQLSAPARLPHPNACLTCPDFQTTPEFLDIHRRQSTVNLRLITRADADARPAWPPISARCKTTWNASSPRSKRSGQPGTRR